MGLALLIGATGLYLERGEQSMTPKLFLCKSSGRSRGPQLEHWGPGRGGHLSAPRKFTNAFT